MIELFGTDDRKRWPLTRTFVDLEGEKKYAYTPCPNDPQFWRKNLINFYLEVARWAADKPNIPGIIMDAEMYGADRSGFASACFCEPCRMQIAERLDVPKAKLTTLMGRRPKKIGGADLELLGRYRAASTAIVRGLATKLREQVREIFPTCLLGGYILDHFGGHTPPFYKGVTLGWGTKQLPVLIFSEATYETGYHAAFAELGRPLLRGTGSGALTPISSWGYGSTASPTRTLPRTSATWPRTRAATGSTI